MKPTSCVTCAQGAADRRRVLLCPAGTLAAGALVLRSGLAWGPSRVRWPLRPFNSVWIEGEVTRAPSLASQPLPLDGCSAVP